MPRTFHAQCVLADAGHDVQLIMRPRLTLQRRDYGACSRRSWPREVSLDLKNRSGEMVTVKRGGVKVALGTRDGAGELRT